MHQPVERSSLLFLSLTAYLPCVAPHSHELRVDILQVRASFLDVEHSGRLDILDPVEV